MAGKTVDVKCKCCGTEFTARVADRKRGWGRFCNKSCGAFWKTHNKRRPPQTPQQLTHAKIKNDILRDVSKLNREGREDDLEVGEWMSDMDYGASDGGGYHSR